ncbi:MAG: hypothetical protein J0G32_05740 [Alphaproteobacteria bacterium]|nr:hypothetical protein [Alphaproteobacteria bacterium]OJV17121.1 MAG: hypothetical protein BGO27_06040 [Alphaproteobacteria bacterium 33-17]
MYKIKLFLFISILAALSYGLYDVNHTYNKVKDLEAQLKDAKEKEVYTCPKCEEAKDCDSFVLEQTKSNLENKFAPVVALRILEKRIMTNKIYKPELDIFAASCFSDQFLTSQLENLYLRSETGITSKDQIFGILDEFVQSRHKTIETHPNLTSSVVDRFIKIESKETPQKVIDEQLAAEIYNIKLSINLHDYDKAIVLLKDLSAKHLDSSLESAIKELEINAAILNNINNIWNYLIVNLIK